MPFKSGSRIKAHPALDLHDTGRLEISDIWYLIPCLKAVEDLVPSKDEN
jgi:hypothetical protein